MILLKTNHAIDEFSASAQRCYSIEHLAEVLADDLPDSETVLAVCDPETWDGKDVEKAITDGAWSITKEYVVPNGYAYEIVK